MTINYLDSKRISALAADTKPTNVQDNSILVEKDTGKRYWFDGTNWTIESPPTSGLKLWLDASDSTTITKDGSNLVSAWNDKSGQLNHVAQATGTKQPLWVDASLNSKPVIRFDGVDNWMRRTTYTGGTLTQPNTIFIVCSFPSGSTKGIIDGGDNTHRHFMYVSNGGAVGIYAGVELTGGTPDSTNRLQYTALYDGASGSLRKSKTEILSGDIGSQTMTGITIGGESGGTQNADIDVAEILVYNVNTSTVDRDDIEQYLTAKWGL